MNHSIRVSLPFVTMALVLFAFVDNSSAHLPPDAEFSDGRMTGGGSVFTDENDYFVPPGTRVTHGFQLHCDSSDRPNNLQVNVHLPDGDGSRFHLEELQLAACWDDPTTDPRRPSAPFDHYYGFGVGRFNGEPGYCADWMFTDEGEPGRDDRIEQLRVWHCETEQFVFSILQEPGHALTYGNHQAHTAKKK